jgi:mannose-6-phosphate isomerase-like protein (cupin superfamily)
MASKIVRTADRARKEQEAKDKGEVATQLLGDDRPGSIMMYASYEDAAGKPELHDNADDIYIIMEGEGTVGLDGKIEGADEVNPGNWFGGKIVGGREIDVAVGDIVDIPRGTPHSVSCPGGKIKLLVVKTTGPTSD